MTCLGLAAGLALYALKDNVTFFYSPSEVYAFEKPHRVFRLGGLVKNGSLEKRKDDLSVSFVITDNAKDITVFYKGILPDLFREGQGVVATGSLEKDGIFDATEILAKHDENYMPPEAAKALEKTSGALR